VYTLRVGEKGRTVLPAELRGAAHIQAGDTLVARLEDGRLIIETRDAVRVRIRAAARKAKSDGQVVDRFLADRRQEAEAEDTRLRRGRKANST
jgi:AbrB family looped-hinge helix DNA binding protein